MGLFKDKRAVSAILLYFFGAWACIATASYIFSLLLKTYNSGVLPYYYVVGAVFQVMLIPYAAARIKNNREIYASIFFAFAAICPIIGYILMSIGIPGVAFAVAVILMINEILLWIVLDNSAALAFDIREFRGNIKYFIIASGIGGAVFGLGSPVLIAFFGNAILIPAISFSLILCLIFNYKLHPLHKHVEEKKIFKNAYSYLLSRFGYQILIFYLIVVAQIVLINYIFLAALNAHYNKDIIAIVLTLYCGVSSLVTVVTQFYFEDWFIQRFGVASAFALAPISIVVFGVTTLVYPGITTIVITMLVYDVTYHGVMSVAISMLLNSISVKKQIYVRSQLVITSQIMGKSVLASGVLFLLGSEYASTRNVILIAVALGIPLFFLLRPIRNFYRNNLKENVAHTRYFHVPTYSLLNIENDSILDQASDPKSIALQALSGSIHGPILDSIASQLRDTSKKCILFARALRNELPEYFRLELESRYQINLQNFLYLFAVTTDTRAVLNAMPKILDGVLVKSNQIVRANAIEYLDATTEDHSLRKLLEKTFEDPHEPLSHNELAELVAADPWLSRIRSYSAKDFVPHANLNLEEKVFFLRRVEVFQCIPAETLETIARSLIELPIKANVEIFHVGDEGDKLYMVVSGHVKLIAKTRKMEDISQFGLFGELSLLDEKFRSARAVAKNDV